MRVIVMTACLLAGCAWGQFGALPVVQVRVASATTWTPLSVAGCVFWLDPSEAASLTLDGTNLVSIVDKSGTGDWGQTNAAVRPYYDGSTINGLGVMRTAATGKFIFSSTPHTVSDVFIVTRTTTYRALSGLYGKQFSDIGLRLAASGIWNNANSSDFAYNGVLRINGVATNRYPTASAYMITARAANPKTDFLSGIGWYGIVYPTRYYVGLIGEVIGYSGPVSDEDRALIEAYLATKWGL